MRGIAPLSGALVIVALLIGAATGPASAATDCGDYKKAENVTADGLSCGDAKAVVKTWLKLCNVTNLCVNDVNRLGEEYRCTGREVGGSSAKLKCRGRDSGYVVKFKAPV